MGSALEPLEPLVPITFKYFYDDFTVEESFKFLVWIFFLVRIWMMGKNINNYRWGGGGGSPKNMKAVMGSIY